MTQRESLFLPSPTIELDLIHVQIVKTLPPRVGKEMLLLSAHGLRAVQGLSTRVTLAPSTTTGLLTWRTLRSPSSTASLPTSCTSLMLLKIRSAGVSSTPHESLSLTWSDTVITMPGGSAKPMRSPQSIHCYPQHPRLLRQIMHSVWRRIFPHRLGYGRLQACGRDHRGKGRARARRFRSCGSGRGGLCCCVLIDRGLHSSRLLNYC